MNINNLGHIPYYVPEYVDFYLEIKLYLLFFDVELDGLSGTVDHEIRGIN